ALDGVLVLDALCDVAKLLNRLALQLVIRVGHRSSETQNLSRLLGTKLERRAVHAIAQSSWRRAVGKHVPQVAAASRAVHLCALHEKAVVDRRFDAALARREEARPAGAALEFRIRRKQRLS